MLKSVVSLTDEEKKKIEEEEKYRSQIKKNIGKVPWWKPKGFGAWVLVILIVLGVIPSIFANLGKYSARNSIPSITTPTLSPEDQKAWDQSKAGKICKDHPTWTKDDCEGLANKKIWIGMSYDMLVYEYGKPDSANPSNYGRGQRWQWCWDDYKPNCFYDNNDDGIIDSYN